MITLEQAAYQALEALNRSKLMDDNYFYCYKAATALRKALEQKPCTPSCAPRYCYCEEMAEQPKQEPVGIKATAKKAGISLPETYIPTMDDAVAAGDSVLMNEQAALLRECRFALDSLLTKKPMLAALLCGSTTLGNLRAELGKYRPQGVFGTAAHNIGEKK